MKLSKRERTYAWLGLAVVTVGACCWKVVLPAWKEWNDLGLRIAEAQRDVSRRKAAANMPDQSELEERLRLQFGDLLETRSEAAHASAKITELESICKISGLKIASYHPLGSSVVDDHWEQFPLRVVVEGDLAELTDTLFRLANGERLLDLERLDVRRKKGDTLSCDMLIATYAYSDQPLRKKRRGSRQS